MRILTRIAALGMVLAGCDALEPDCNIRPDVRARDTAVAAFDTVRLHAQSEDPCDPHLRHRVPLPSALCLGGLLGFQPRSGLPFQTLNAVAFATPTEGHAVGSSGLILRTTDGGIHWDSLPMPSMHVLYSVHFPLKHLGYACGDSGTIFRTLDGGKSWTDFRAPTDLSLADSRPKQKRLRRRRSRPPGSRAVGKLYIFGGPRVASV